MLFNSFLFVFAFLPVTLAGFFLVSRYRQTHGAAWLTLASLVFYAAWNPRYLIFLLGSIAFNFVAGRNIVRLSGKTIGKWLLLIAIAVNLGLLGYFKYATFFTEKSVIVLGRPIAILRVILPLGISFFTFTQIAYLVDAWRGKASEPSLSLHAVRHLFPPSHRRAHPAPLRDDAAVSGCGNLSLQLGSAYRRLGHVLAGGCSRRWFWADGVSQFVAPVFSSAEAGITPSLPDSRAVRWPTFELDHDFSGYCDMAIGMSWISASLCRSISTRPTRPPVSSTSGAAGT